MVNLSAIDFWSESNYMKRSEFCGSTSLTLGGLGSTVEHVVEHNLNYIPFFEVFTDTRGDGIVWAPQPINIYTESSLLSGTDPPDVTVRYWSTTTELTIQLINNTSPVASGSRTVYWLIYLDYSEAT